MKQSIYRDSTIYNYQLMSRIHHTKPKLLIYVAFILPLIVYDVLGHHWSALFITYPSVLTAHQLVLSYYFKYTNGGTMKGWEFRLGLFWAGTLPKGHCPVRIVRKIQLHIFLVGLAVLIALYPWISSLLLFHLFVAHAWLCLPRLLILMKFRPYDERGLIKISDKDTSCYYN